MFYSDLICLFFVFRVYGWQYEVSRIYRLAVGLVVRVRWLFFWELFSYQMEYRCIDIDFYAGGCFFLMYISQGFGVVFGRQFFFDIVVFFVGFISFFILLFCCGVLRLVFFLLQDSVCSDYRFFLGFLGVLCVFCGMGGRGDECLLLNGKMQVIVSQEGGILLFFFCGGGSGFSIYCRCQLRVTYRWMVVLKTWQCRVVFSGSYCYSVVKVGLGRRNDGKGE